jgi:hypothetical protein
MLCALVFSAFAAQSASALGTTAFTCKEEAKAEFKYKDAHCKEVSTGGNTGKFNHVAFAVPTEIIGTNEKTEAETTLPRPSKLHATLNGVKVTLDATGVSGTGTMENKEVGTEMVASGTGVITYTGVTVTPPFEENCEVAGGSVVTSKLKAETVPTGLKFAPETGEVFATFEIVTKAGAHAEVCPIIKKYSVVGSVIGTIEGATTTSTAAGTTAQGTLRLESKEGPKAGLDGAITISGRTGGAGAYTPLSVT